MHCHWFRSHIWQLNHSWSTTAMVNWSYIVWAAKAILSKCLNRIILLYSREIATWFTTSSRYVHKEFSGIFYQHKKLIDILNLFFSRPKQMAKVQPNQMWRTFFICGQVSNALPKRPYRVKWWLRNMAAIYGRTLCTSESMRTWNRHISCKPSKANWLCSKANASILIRAVAAAFIQIRTYWKSLEMLRIIRRQFRCPAKLSILLPMIVSLFVRLMAVIGFGVVPAQLVGSKHFTLKKWS